MGYSSTSKINENPVCTFFSGLRVVDVSVKTQVHKFCQPVNPCYELPILDCFSLIYFHSGYQMATTMLQYC